MTEQTISASFSETARAAGTLPDMPNGAWPVMITPFTQDNQIDWAAYDQLIDFYMASGVSGLFSVCLSSELYCLSKQERVDLAKVAVRRADARVPVIAVGVADNTHEPSAIAEAVKEMAGTGVDAVVCLTNNFCAQADNEQQWLAQVEKFLEKADPSIPLGIYECPLPYARNISADALGWLAKTGRFVLTKDTCCRQDDIRAKVAAVRGSALRFYNADSCTLLDSMRHGGHGYSGIAANFMPHLFSWMCARHAEKPELADELSAFFKHGNHTIHQRYMQSAKIYLNRAGLKIGPRTRVAEHDFTPEALALLDALRAEVEQWERTLGIENPFALLR